MPRRRRIPTTNQHYSTGTTPGTLRASQSKLVQDNTQDTQDCQVSSTTTSLMQEIQSFPIVTNLQLQQTDPDLDADKKTIVNHPLYPLLAALLQQCELASARPDSPPPLDAFTEELRAYVQRQFELEDTDLIKSKLKDKDYYTNSFVEQHSYTNTSSGGAGRLTRAGSRYKQNGSGDVLGKGMRPQSRDKSKDSVEKSNSLMDVEYGHDPNTGLDSGPFEEDRKLNVFVNDRELDELIVKAIQVLRIHLLELHKVNELCKDFCSRYIHSLKTKFQSDPMIQDSQPSSPGDSEVQSPGPAGTYNSRYFPTGTPSFMCQSSNELVPPEFRRRPLTSLEEEQFRLAAAASTDLGGCPLPGYPQLNGHGSSYGASTDVSGLCYTPNYHLLDYGTGQFGSKAGEEHTDAFGQLHPFLSPYGAAAAAAAANSAAFHARLDNLCVDGKQKRGVLPKRATQIMKQWLFQHLVHPYPTEDEKRQIASQTNLTLLQVNNWFINARRRILQPMLDASNFIPLGNHCGDGTTEGGGSGEGLGSGESHVINRKKKAATSRPSNNRFWPASLVAAAAIHPVAAGLVSTTGGTCITTSCTLSSSSYVRDVTNRLRGTDEESETKNKETVHYPTSNKSHCSALDLGTTPRSDQYPSPNYNTSSKTMDPSTQESDRSTWNYTSRENKFPLGKHPTNFISDSEQCPAGIGRISELPLTMSYESHSPNRLHLPVGVVPLSEADASNRTYMNQREASLTGCRESKALQSSYNQSDSIRQPPRALLESDGIIDQASGYRVYQNPDLRESNSNATGTVKPTAIKTHDQLNSNHRSIKHHSGVTSATLELVRPVSNASVGERMPMNGRIMQFSEPSSTLYNTSTAEPLESSLNTLRGAQPSNTETDLTGAHDFSGKNVRCSPGTYPPILLNHAQQYSQYLASNMIGLNCPLSSSDNGASLQSQYLSDPAHNNTLGNVPHLQTFYNPSFSATSLLSPNSSIRSEPVSSIFGGLSEPWSSINPNTFCSQADIHGDFANCPLPSSWTNKFRRLTPSSPLHTELSSDQQTTPPVSSQVMPTPPNNSEFLSMTNSTRTPENVTSVYPTQHDFPFFSPPSDKALFSASDYFRTTNDRHDSNLSKLNNYPSQCDYQSDGLTPDFCSPHNLSNTYLSTSHSIAP